MLDTADVASLSCSWPVFGRPEGRRSIHPTEVVMKKYVLRLITETEGQDLIEYALLAALVALGAVAGMTALAGGINQKFTDVSTSLGSAS